MSSKRLLFAALAAGLVLAALPQRSAAHDEPVIGSLVGAGIGAAIGGPPGAAVGAIVGGAIGSHAAHQTDHGNGHAHRHRHHSRARIDAPRRETVRYSRVTHHYSGNGNGNGASAASCEPERAYYRPRVAHRDDRPKAVHASAAKPRVKKVCRYVAVKDAG